MLGILGSESHENLIVGVLIHEKFNSLNFTIRTLDRAAFVECRDGVVVVAEFIQNFVGMLT